MTLTQQTPSEIDEQLAEIHGRLVRARQTVAFYSKPSRPWRAENDRETADRLASLSGAQSAVEMLAEEMRPFEQEYMRRGRWQRAFFCTTNGGHVHRTMSCSTCGPRTEFTWQTWLSGKTEQEIIDAIGMTACTVCYPTAPVAQMTTEQRKAHARDEVEARKAAKAAVKLERELAKVPRAHAAALKVDELVQEFGLVDDGRAYRSMWAEGSQFAKGYDTAYTTWSDIVSSRARAQRRAA